MKITDEQFKTAYHAFITYDGTSEPSVRAAIESLPEPLPRLRPLAEMPAEVPEGALRLFGRKLGDGKWYAYEGQKSREDSVGLDVLPPLPESPKPSLQDELVTGLELMVEEMESEIHDRYDGTSSLESRLAELDRARALIAKAKGAPQR